MKDTSLDLTIDHFPIRELSERTGVNSVTLRAWERRYGLLKPFRTSKGHRLYHEADVERVQRILYWINQGVAVSKVRALLSESDTSRPMQEPENLWLTWQQDFQEAVEAFALVKWEKMLLESIKQYPLSVFLRQGLLPALQTLQSRSKNHAALVLLYASLEELLLSFMRAPKKARSQRYECLILAIDGQSILARIIAWVHSQNVGGTLYIPNVRSIEEANELIAAMVPRQVIIVGDAVAHQDVKRWSNEQLSFTGRVAWVGSSFWFDGQQGNRSVHDCYTDSYAYIDSIL